MTAGYELVYLERGGHREARLQANGWRNRSYLKEGVPKIAALTMRNHGILG